MAYGTVNAGAKSSNQKLTFEGGAVGSYDGSTAQTITIPKVPEALKNPNALSFGGAVSGNYDGSEKLTVEIPAVPTAIKNPYALKFTGGAAGSYDGSEEVTIDIPTASGGVAAAEDELIFSTVVDDEVSAITIDQDNDGAAFNLKKWALEVNIPWSAICNEASPSYAKGIDMLDGDEISWTTALNYSYSGDHRYYHSDYPTNTFGAWPIAHAPLKSDPTSTDKAMYQYFISYFVDLDKGVGYISDSYMEYNSGEYITSSSLTRGTGRIFRRVMLGAPLTKLNFTIEKDYQTVYHHIVKGTTILLRGVRA